jgi:hypothetical protein
MVPNFAITPVHRPYRPPDLLRLRAQPLSATLPVYKAHCIPALRFRRNSTHPDKGRCDLVRCYLIKIVIPDEANSLKSILCFICIIQVLDCLNSALEAHTFRWDYHNDVRICCGAVHLLGHTSEHQLLLRLLRTIANGRVYKRRCPLSGCTS